MGPNSTLLDCLTGQGVTLGANTTVPGGPGDVRVESTVFEGQRLGALLADRVCAEGDVSFAPGVLVGPNAHLRTGVTVSEKIKGHAEVFRYHRLCGPGRRASINLLGAVTDDGDRFISLIEGSFTGKVTAHFLRALQEEFGQQLVIVLDNAPYFIVKHLKK